MKKPKLTKLDFNTYLLLCLQEEATEVAHRASKAIRFGLQEEHDKVGRIDNADLLHGELADLAGVVYLCQAAGLLPINDMNPRIKVKQAKVLEYFDYSKELGRAK